MKKSIFIIITGALVFSGLFFYRGRSISKNSISVKTENKSVTTVQNQDKQELGSEDIKLNVLISVPFTTQAPVGSWLPPYNESCEEANLIMATRWVRGQSLTPTEASSEIFSLVVFENKLFGFNEDTNIEQTAQLIRDYYHYNNYEVKKNVSLIDIKRELSVGNIVLVPMAGKLLNNSHFTPPGPDYHMLLIRGYDEKNRVFITNDPGTKYGEGYPYNYLTIDNAWHGWTGSVSTILQGGRNMIVIRK